MTEELRLLLDERAIGRVMQTYCHAMDHGPHEAWADCFTNDGTFDVRTAEGNELFRVSGREDLLQFIAAYPEQLPKYYKHLYLSPIIEVDTDTATAESYVVVMWCEEGGPAEISSFGKVNDRFIRTDLGWKIQERIALTEAMPVNESQHISWSSES